MELFWKIFSAKWVQNNPATEPMALYSHKHEESEGQVEDKPEGAWPWKLVAGPLS